MKRVVILVVAALATVSAGHAQVLFKFDKKAIQDAIAQSDADIVHPKRSTRGQTWLDRGDAMFNAAGALLTQIYPGQKVNDMTLRLGKPDATTKKEVKDKTYDVMEYPYADVYLAPDGSGTLLVQFWIMKETVLEGAADKAIEAYKKAVELDAKLLPKAVAGLSSVGDIYSIQANREYNLGNDAAAADSYYKAFQVKKDPILGKIDSVSIFNAGYINLMAEKYDKAIPMLEEAIANNVWEAGKTPFYLSHALIQTEQYDKAKGVLLKGLELFPGDKSLIEYIIYVYNKTNGDLGEIKGMLEKAREKDPGNVVVWNGLAQLYRNEKDPAVSEKFFTEYAAAFPEEMQPNFYMGDMLMEKGNAARDGGDMAKAKQLWNQAWSYMEKAYDKAPTERAVVQRLQHLSYSLENEANVTRYTKEYEALGGGGDAE